MAKGGGQYGGGGEGKSGSGEKGKYDVSLALDKEGNAKIHVSYTGKKFEFLAEGSDAEKLLGKAPAAADYLTRIANALYGEKALSDKKTRAQIAQTYLQIALQLGSRELKPEQKTTILDSVIYQISEGLAKTITTVGTATKEPNKFAQQVAEEAKKYVKAYEAIAGDEIPRGDGYKSLNQISKGGSLEALAQGASGIIKGIEALKKALDQQAAEQQGGKQADEED